jgi:uncharacterized metal-binding protein YceD (DUF177 family)
MLPISCEVPAAGAASAADPCASPSDEGDPLTTEPELSRRYALDRVGSAGVHFDISASADERSALARRLELSALRRLGASGSLERRGSGQVIALSCRVTADLDQPCVVTTEPVPAVLDLVVERLFIPVSLDRGAAVDDRGEIALSPDLEEPDPLGTPFLDVGEIVTEEVALALDPYPHAPGADALPAAANCPAGPGRPFAALAALRGRAH